MRVLIVDDEALARERLLRMLRNDEDSQSTQSFEIVGEVASGIDAVEICSSQEVDIVLMDIRMPGMDGLEAARHLLNLDEPPAVVFCTAYEEHAIQAFELQAVGYLLKPVRKEKLLTALDKASHLNRAQLASLGSEDTSVRTHISARTHRGLELIDVATILYFMADQKYVTLCHQGGEVLLDETLKELEDEFTDRLLRIHRSTLVARAHIESIQKDGLLSPVLKLRGSDQLLPISRRHLAQVRRVIKSGL